MNSRLLTGRASAGAISNGMRLLITTQAVDNDDPVLGFFVGWISELAKHYESIYVVCLKEGKHQLPSNVSVHSLGKESGPSRLKYVARFYRLLFSLRANYDSVFVHMNQEYVLLGGVFWRLLGKRIYLWRNHWAGGFATDIAAALCTKVFCTSRHSYTAKYKKTVIMPIGVDAERFKPVPGVTRTPRSILFLARMAPSKRPDVLFEAFRLMQIRGLAFSASFVGSPLPVDKEYYDRLMRTAEERGMRGMVEFKAGIPNAETPAVYSAHEIFVNLSRSGMYDKTIPEAAACGCVVLASSDDFAAAADPRFVFKDADAKDLAEKLSAILTLSDDDRRGLQSSLSAFVSSNSLQTLGARLAQEISV